MGPIARYITYYQKKYLLCDMYSPSHNSLCESWAKKMGQKEKKYIILFYII